MSIKYPYTDFHEMNLDWTLQTAKKAGEDSAEALETANATEERVNEFFDTLDLQEEVDNKINEMAADGSLADVVDPVVLATLPPVVVDNVSDMLDPRKTYILSSNGHVYQYRNGAFVDTGVIFGSSLANVVEYGGVISSGTDIEDLSTETIYIASSGYIPADAPVPYPGFVETIGGSTGAKSQTYTVFDTGKVYYRSFINNTWSAWSTDTPVEYLGTLLSTADLDIIPVQSIFKCAAGNIPINAPNTTIEGFVFTYGDASGSVMQIYKELHGPRQYFRRKASGTWGSWTDGFGYSLQYRGTGHGGNYPLPSLDLNNASGMSVYTVNPGVGLQNMPKEEIGFLYTFGVDGAARTQVFMSWDNGDMYYRHSTSVSAPLTWTAWKIIAAGGNPNSKMYSIGNSILTGSVWLNGVYNHLAEYNNAPYGVIANSIGIPRQNVEHHLYSSTGLYYDAGDGNFLSHIKSTNLAPYDVVLTHLWTADLSLPFGDDNSVAGDGTVCGVIRDLLDYMKTSNGNCQLILVSVPPVSTSIYGPNTFIGSFYNHGSLGDLETLLTNVAKKWHFVFAGWQDLNLSYYYHDFTDGMNVHANNENTYRVMGAHIGGQAGSKIHF